MMSSVLVFPDQLFYDHPCIVAGRTVVLVEEERYFADLSAGIRFHKMKLMLHRASMREYALLLRSRGHDVRYEEYSRYGGLDGLFSRMALEGTAVVHAAEFSNRPLERAVNEAAGRWGVTVRTVPSPGFVTGEPWLRDFFSEGRRYAMVRFYQAQRKRLAILVDKGRPTGGKWSFDRENRKRLRKGTLPPPPEFPMVRPSVWEAARYVESRFGDHPGETSRFFYPVTHGDALRWLEGFVRERLKGFGDYEDAISRKESLLFHSVLSPLLNTGLLTPDQILSAVLRYADEKGDVPLNDLEGFVRQIIGWREFMRAIYLLEGEREKESNFWHHERPVPPPFYSASTGFPPVDEAIRRVTVSGYVHHIERLMILGNIMLLCRIDPKAVYRWFMEMFIDSYEWVMVPNVFGMSQYADGGLITTKPYISSSSYILRMSDYPRGEWCDLWDGLFWTFVDDHRDFFAANGRMVFLAGQLNRMGKDRLRAYREGASSVFERLFSQS